MFRPRDQRRCPRASVRVRPRFNADAVGAAKRYPRKRWRTGRLVDLGDSEAAAIVCAGRNTRRTAPYRREPDAHRSREPRRARARSTFDRAVGMIGGATWRGRGGTSWTGRPPRPRSAKRDGSDSRGGRWPYPGSLGRGGAVDVVALPEVE